MKSTIIKTINKNKQKNYRILGILFVLISSLAILMQLEKLWEYRYLKENGIPLMAKIGFVESNAIYCKYVIGEKAYNFRHEIYDHNFRKGDSVKIVYDPKYPETIMLSSELTASPWSRGFWSIIVGSVQFLLIGIFVIVKAGKYFKKNW
ncbi:MAG: hypothetical protein HF982_03720 [Desulfobacteraceae bacterium]|nr:hypothetical protein [Desulfobacteraceae bacterium]MBC2718694.1 hypothetical protein [Desulfobacteraceae bacterium]